MLAEADSLWRGDALADFTYEEFATAAIARLSELRLAVIEERLDLELALGRHQGVIVQLEELVAAHPLRERLRGLLMLALYRAGRQADALRVFQDGRHILGDELGLEPSHELRQLESAILAQDRSLDSPAVAGRDPIAGPERRSIIPEALTPLSDATPSCATSMQLLAEHRFVTLVGPGGVGKTRLALEVARAESAGLQFGGCLVELAPVGDPAGVRAAIASALELPDPSRLAELIGDREMLIVLDNCEHVIATAAEVAEDLLRRCPGLRILATSREGLRVGGETIWPVPPLAGRRRRAALRRAAPGRPARRSRFRRAPRADRRHLRAPRRSAARDRARGGPHPGVPDRADLLPPERSVPLAHRRVAHRAPAPTNATRGRRLELRAPLRRRAARLRAGVGVPGRL